MSLENRNEPRMNAMMEVPDLLHRQGDECG